MSQAKCVLRLYIEGITPENQDAILIFKSHLKGIFGKEYKLEAVDIMANPERADEDDIIATPTLVRRFPGPPQKIVMNFEDKAQLLFEVDSLIKG